MVLNSTLLSKYFHHATVTLKTSKVEDVTEKKDIHEKVITDFTDFDGSSGIKSGEKKISSLHDW